jgi:triosephosphate isomerase (TIM)
MKKLIIANLKTYLNLQDTTSLLSSIPNGKNIVIAPSTIHLGLLAQKFPNLAFAAQDVSGITNNYGAHTGEIPAVTIKDIGVNYSIIGHSERRSSMLDNANTIAAKLIYCLRSSVTPIICIGETIEDRKSKKHLEIISQQLHSILDNIGDSNSDIIVAYEPFWSVGTGILPTLDEIKEVINTVKKTVNFVDNRLFLVYGGSVNSQNAKDLINLDGLDGLLIGKASTNIEQFKSILSVV